MSEPWWKVACAQRDRALVAELEEQHPTAANQYFLGLRSKGDPRGLARERHNELAGDERFFDLLEETLRKKGDEADARLEVYYTCLGLGFTGFYAGEWEQLRSKSKEIAARLPGLRERRKAGRFTPEAYEHLDTSDLVEPAGRRLVGIAVAVVGLGVAVAVAVPACGNRGRSVPFGLK